MSGCHPGSVISLVADRNHFPLYRTMAALLHTIGVLEQCTIGPPSSVSTTSLALTIFDILWVAQPPIQRIFFYEVDHSTPHFVNAVLPNIKRSLSLTLQHFFLLAGKLSWRKDCNKPEIIYNEGDSVKLIVAESSYDFHHLSGHHQRAQNDFSPLIPQLTKPNVSDAKHFPVLALQVTLFPNKGICIGVTYQHGVGDGKSIMQFIKAWALVCRSQGDTSFITEYLPSYERSMVIVPKDLETTLLKLIKDNNITQEIFNLPSQPSVPSDTVVATFVMRVSDVRKLKQWVLARLDNRKIVPPKHLSTFVLTCAYIWVCLIKVRKTKEGVIDGGEDPIEQFAVLIDCRARLKPPLPPTYFGNCLACATVETTQSHLLEEDGIAIAANLIGNLIQNFDPRNATIGKIYFERLVSVAGSPKLGAYDTNFGWGNPIKAEIETIGGAGAIGLCECPTELGAVEVGLARTKTEMDALTSLFAETLEKVSHGC